MGQVKTVILTTKQIMHRAEFSKGYYEVLSGLPFKDSIEDARKQWHYERGRQFACYMKSLGVKHMKLKDGKEITNAALRFYNNAVEMRIVL